LDTSITPGSYKLALSIIKPQPPSLWILTGDRNSGKTYRCSELVSYLKETNLSIGGILCPPVFHDNQKVAIKIVDIQTEQSRLLGCTSTSETCTIHVGNWWLDPEVITWGNQIIHKATNSDILLIDEIGPLELEFDKGLTAAIHVLDKEKYNRAVVVIRPELLSIALNRWHQAIAIHIERALQ